MRILYGVQATGNGHITRARVMAPALHAQGLEVDYLFSGRPADELFNMEPFGTYRCRRGLTFRYRPGGRVDIPGTALRNNLWRLAGDIRRLDLDGYDLVISDFEPITAWAARRQSVRSLGVAHQYAFNHRLPGHHQGWMNRAAVRLMAPVDTAIGLHWDPFGQPILPPLIPPPLHPITFEHDKILVYLPCEPLERLVAWFGPFPDFRFRIYCAVEAPRQEGNLHLCPFSRTAFERDLASCAGVISNSGFGLASETVQYGKKLLSKPLQGQFEQLSNAEIMSALGMATVVDDNDLEPGLLRDWLAQSNPMPAPYPDVAGALARWIATGQRESVVSLAERLWAQHGAGIGTTQLPELT